MNKLLKFLSVLGLGYILSGCVIVAHQIHSSKPPPTAVVELQKNTVTLIMGEELCSGWVLKDTHQIVTAAHCIQDPTEPVVAVFPGESQEQGHKFYARRVGNAEEGPDIATLITNDTQMKWPEGLSICDFKPYYGEFLGMFGAPLGNSDTISYGWVSKPVAKIKGHTDFIQFDGQMWPGNSGGAVIDLEESCVIGMAEMIMTTPNHLDAVGVNFLTPSSQIEQVNI